MGALQPQGPVLGRHCQESLEWGVHFGVRALAINTVQMSQCCGQHGHGPALAPMISNMALGGGVVVLPGLHGEVAVARWLCCWRRTLGRTHAPWP